MNFPLEKYKFIVLPEQKKVIAISSYAGRPVRGIAKCSPQDEFDVEKGKKLAAARCNEKVAEKRYDRAISKQLSAYNAYMEAYIFLRRMEEYLGDAEIALDAAYNEVDDLESEM